MSLCARKPTIWVPTRSDTNWAVQSPKMARGLKFVFKLKRDCTIGVAKTKALISFGVTAKLLCAFVFAQAFCWFSYAVAHIMSSVGTVNKNCLLELCKELLFSIYMYFEIMAFGSFIGDKSRGSQYKTHTDFVESEYVIVPLNMFQKAF